MKKLFIPFFFLFCYVQAEKTPCQVDNCKAFACCNTCDFTPPCAPDCCGYNAPFIVDIKCGWNLFLSGSFVYAQAVTQAGQWAELRFPQIEADTEIFKTFQLCFDYKPGFKIGAGYRFGCDDWYFNAEYFRYYNKVGHGSEKYQAESIDQRVFVQLFVADRELSIGATTHGDIQSTWELNLDIVDFFLSRQFYVGKCLTFTPSVGLRCAWFTQKYVASGQFEGFTQGVTFSQVVDISQKDSTWSVGPAVSFNSNWLFCGNFRFIVDTLLGVLYTEDTQTSSLNNDSTLSFINGFITFEPNKKAITFSTHLHLFLGLGWSSYFCCNDYYSDISIGYEVNAYQDQYVLYYRNPNIYLHGLVVKLGIEF